MLNLNIRHADGCDIQLPHPSTLPLVLLFLSVRNDDVWAKMRPSTAQLRRNAVKIAAQSQLALHEQKNVAGWSQTDVVGTIHHIYVAGPNFSLGRHLVKHGSLIQRPRVLITELQKAMPQSSDCFPSPIALVCVPSTLCTHTSATKYISQGIGG